MEIIHLSRYNLLRSTTPLVACCIAFVGYLLTHPAFNAAVSSISYFEYMSKAFFHKLPTVLCKIVGVYQIGYHNKTTGKRQMDQASGIPKIAVKM